MKTTNLTKRTSLAIAMMGIVLGAAACQSAPEEPVTGPAAPAKTAAHADHHGDDGAPLTQVMLSFAPGDLSSDIGPTPITLFADNGMQGVDTALLDEIADQIELRTYPELEPVEAEIRVVPSKPAGRILRAEEGKKGAAQPSEPPPDHAGRASIVVRPSRPLAARWYVVSLASVPKGVRPVGWTGTTDPALGAFAARFHPTSQPVVREVRLCSKEGGQAARLVASFSEGMHVDADSAQKLVRAQDGESGEACQVVTPANPDMPQTMLEIDCPASVLRGRSVEMTLSAALTSMSGAPLSSIEARGRASGVDEAIDFSEVTEVSGCRTVVMQ